MEDKIRDETLYKGMKYCTKKMQRGATEIANDEILYKGMKYCTKKMQRRATEIANHMVP